MRLISQVYGEQILYRDCKDTENVNAIEQKLFVLEAGPVTVKYGWARSSVIATTPTPRSWLKRQRSWTNTALNILTISGVIAEANTNMPTPVITSALVHIEQPPPEVEYRRCSIFPGQQASTKMETCRSSKQAEEGVFASRACYHQKNRKIPGCWKTL